MSLRDWWSKEHTRLGIPRWYLAVLAIVVLSFYFAHTSSFKPVVRELSRVVGD